ncbi:cytochrome C oxidase subunit II [Paenibacillus sp. HB172176]|uniref:cytochrome C oxidase subunit II n=1 Tax=Paenibacillus sp. HB172176 TaxID=2493690 RepID=UPI00143AFD3A|nr:cytochrome C oxidase subunit II [Paenibacillus sp. HB172176]
MHKWIMFVVFTAASLLGVYLLTFGLPEKPVDESANLPEGTVLINLQASATDFSFGQDEFKVKVGDKVFIKLNNKIGIHGAKIDELGVELSADNPKSEELDFTEPGEYLIYCDIPCGQGHSTMNAKLIVEAA